MGASCSSNDAVCILDRTANDKYYMITECIIRDLNQSDEKLSHENKVILLNRYILFASSMDKQFPKEIKNNLNQLPGLTRFPLKGDMLQALLIMYRIREFMQKSYKKPDITTLNLKIETQFTKGKYTQWLDAGFDLINGVSPRRTPKQISPKLTSPKLTRSEKEQTETILPPKTAKKQNKKKVPKKQTVRRKMK